MSFYLVNGEELIFVPYNLLAIDFEFITTRVIENKAKRYFQEIVEAGLVFRSENGIQEYSAIVRPKYFIEAKNTDKNSIYSERFSPEEIKGGVDLREVLDKITNMYTPGETVWISWGRAEYDALKKVWKANNKSMSLLKEDYLDLSIELKDFYGINQNLSLDRALSYLDISIENRHRALPDAKALINIMDRMFLDGYRLNEKSLELS
jgi:sporulation inhibitor KapD